MASSGSRHAGGSSPAGRSPRGQSLELPQQTPLERYFGDQGPSVASGAADVMGLSHHGGSSFHHDHDHGEEHGEEHYVEVVSVGNAGGQHAGGADGGGHDGWAAAPRAPQRRAFVAIPRFPALIFRISYRCNNETASQGVWLRLEMAWATPLRRHDGDDVILRRKSVSFPNLAGPQGTGPRAQPREKRTKV